MYNRVQRSINTGNHKPLYLLLRTNIIKLILTFMHHFSRRIQNIARNNYIADFCNEHESRFTNKVFIGFVRRPTNSDPRNAFRNPKRQTSLPHEYGLRLTNTIRYPASSPFQRWSLGWFWEAGEQQANGLGKEV